MSDSSMKMKMKKS